MKTITIVTGNPGKVRELQAMAAGQMDFRMKDLDLPEIQSLDLYEIIKDKVTRAYDVIKAPVIVEDVSAGLDSMNGLPGPFIKFFNQALGNDSLLKLAKVEGEKVTIKCLAAYYDGKRILFGEGVIHGVVVKPRGKSGFGFDFTVMPDGQKRTMAEMAPAQKNKISHRGHAFRNLLKQIEALSS